MKLEPDQESILRGESGRALALAMKTLVDYGDAFGAGRLVPVRSGHLAGTFGAVSFKAYYEILDRLVADGVKVRVPTTLNPRPGHKLGLVSRVVFYKQAKLERQLEALGVTPNYSCVCYEDGNRPGPGDNLGWAESSAVQFANSVLGARTNRNSILIDVCSAVTGVTPEFGYLLDENRRGRLLVKVSADTVDVSALGFVIGRVAVNRVPVIEHIDLDEVDLKNMGGAMAASGAVALFHVEGLTPEAPDMKTAFDGEKPDATITITQADLDGLRTREPGNADLLVFGCPQMSFDEAVALASRFSGRRVGLPTWFCLNPAARERFGKTKHFEDIRAAGVEVYTHCPLAALTMMKNTCALSPSGKLFYYLDGSEYGTVDDCLRACGAEP